MNEIILQAQALTIGYRPTRSRTVVVAANITVALRRGELVALIGPNGAGKSTLLRTLAGMQPPLAGQVLLLGDDVHRLSVQERARRLSVVLTERVSAGMLSGYALVALGRHPYTDWTGRLSAQDEAVVHRVVEAVGAAALAARPVDELSDGERQKLMIARALAQEPALLLLDEPTAYLDLPRRAEIMQLLRHLAHTTRQSILLSTHDLDLALRTADRLWLLTPGGALHTGAPEDLVLSGVLEAAFHSEGVKFDPYSGAFRTIPNGAGHVALHGEGLPALWTRRALEREGYSLAVNGHIPVGHVEVGGDSQPVWYLSLNSAGQVEHEYHSLYELLAALKTASGQTSGQRE